MPLLWVFAAGSSVQAQDDIAGHLVTFSGAVEVRRSLQPQWVPATTGQDLAPGDTIRTGANATASLRLSDESLIRLNRNSELELRAVAQTSGWGRLRGLFTSTAAQQIRSLFRLGRGEIWLRNNNRDVAIEVETPTMTAGVRGTEFNLSIGANDAVTLVVLEGLVSAANPLGQVEAAAGQAVVARPGEPPTLVLLVSPQDAVQWTIRVPALIAAREIASDTDSTEVVLTLIDLLAQRRYDDVRRGLAPAIAATPEDVGLQILAAALDLYQTRIDEAHERATQLSESQPDHPLPWRLYAVTALLLGDTSSATAAAERAVALAPDAASAWIVLSYVRQANFDLPEALLAIDRALEISPTNLTALLNRAQLLFGSDRIDESWEALTIAGSIEPSNAQFLNLRGFVRFARGDRTGALQDFSAALMIDSSLAEPHMGLSIAAMRSGDVPSALEEIATAVLLDPQRSLFLSYWGKMLYQVRRFDRALEVLSRAQQLDENDPTPLFYRAIIMRDLNRPGEAVRLFDQAIALNDNRAVYRSRFLLDQDLAARNVDLSIVYSQLGLNAWAHNRAIESIRSDYTNASAHVFNAGALALREGRAQAQSTEALLARILQPVNINSVNNFNEYTVLFDQPGIEGTAVAVAGNHNTLGTDVFLFGASESQNLSYSVGANYADTDGWRDTNGDRFRRVAGVLNWQPARKDKFLFSGSTFESVTRDRLFDRFSVDAPSHPTDRSRSTNTRFELGYRRELSESANVLAYVSRFDNDGRQTTIRSDPLTEFGPDVSLRTDTRVDFETPYTQGQLQYIGRHGQHQIIAGGLFYDGTKRASQRLTSTLDISGQLTPLPEFDTLFSGDLDVYASSVYIQDIWSLRDDLTIEAAAYVDRFDNANAFTGGEWRLTGFNPRLAAVLRPTTRDTVRVAAFRYVLPFIAPRLDPADIGGVFIFRNAAVGTVVEEADVAWERGWSGGFWTASAFYLKTEDTTGFLSEGEQTRTVEDGRLAGVETEINLLLGDQLGAIASYQYVDAENESFAVINRIENRVSIALNYLRPDGVAAAVSQTFRHLNFDDRPSESIWITAVAIGYEFPGKRAAASLAVDNLLDHKFNWVTDAFTLAGRRPARSVAARLVVNF